MDRKMSLFLSFLSLSAFLLGSAWAQKPSKPPDLEEIMAKTIESKIAIEANLEKRVHSLLTQVIGPGKSMAMINVELLSFEQLFAKKMKEEKEKRLTALPGVPVQKEDPTKSLRASLTMVQSMSAILLIDKTVPEKQVELAKTMVGELLDISEARGDKLVVQRMSFFRDTRKSPFLTPDFWRIVWILLATGALFVFLRYFLSPLIGIGKEFVTAFRARSDSGGAEGEGRAGTTSSTMVATQLTDGAVPAAGSPSGSRASSKGEEALFSFVHKGNLPNLIHLLKRSPPQAISVVVNYLPAAMAAEVLTDLPPATLAEVTRLLANVSEMNEKVVRQFEAQIRLKIDYMVGGEGRLLEVLEELTPKLQQTALAQLRSKNPQAADKLNRRIVRLEDLAELDGPALRTVLRYATFSVVSHVLQEDTKLADKILPKLTEALGNRLKQEIASARALPPQMLEEHRRKIVTAMKQLAREGWIELKKG